VISNPQIRMRTLLGMFARNVGRATGLSGDGRRLLGEHAG
jgi:hypothetical protein